MSYSVGGFEQSTVITADRVDTEILRVWDDSVGEKIQQEVVKQAAALRSRSAPLCGWIHNP